jgi:NitT/TauT family transport system permease protein
MSESQAALETNLSGTADDLAMPPKGLWHRFEAVILGTSTIVIALILWELLPRIVTLSAGTKLFFTTPSQIAGTLWKMFATGSIWHPLSVSASGFAVGLGLAIIVGLPLGVLIGRSRTLNAMFDPFITAFNATPRLVFLPLVMLWFGLGLWSKVVIVFIGALFPILINTYEGVRNSDKLLINVVRSFGAKEWDVARLVVVPNAMPYIIAGLRLSIGRAVLGVVVAEFFGSESGLGVMMVQAAGRYQIDIVFSGLIIFAAMTLAMTAAVQVLENRLGRWRPQRAGGE